MKNDFMKSKRTLISLISIALIVLCCVIMLISVFLPFVKATDDLELLLRKNKKIYVDEDLGMKGKDMIRLSIVKLTRLVVNGVNDEMIIFFGVFLAFFIILPVFMMIAAAIKQGLAVLMHNVLFVTAFVAYSKMLEVDELVSEDTYAWSVGFVLCIICIVLIFLASLTLIVLKLLRTKFVQNYIEKRELNKSIYQRELSQYQEQRPADAMYKEKIPNKAKKHVDCDSSEIIYQIKQYRDLVDQGIISEEDYNAKKKQLLGI